MNDPHAVHCMVDIETLGSADDAPIVQLGAVLFNPWGTGSPYGSPKAAGCISEPGSEFSWCISPGDRTTAIDWQTLLWWMAQGQQAQQRVFGRDNQRRPLSDTLRHFESWSRSWDRPVDFWWSDMDFDLRLMRAAWKRAGLFGSPPYGAPDGPHRGVRDCRTVRAIGRDLGIEPPPFVGIEHDALDDAIHQAIEVSNILRKIIPTPTA